MNEHKCIQENVIKDMEQRLRFVERQSTESTILLKNISDQIKELKDEFKIYVSALTQPKSPKQELTQAIIIELIKAITLAITILGAIAGAGKIIGG